MYPPHNPYYGLFPEKRKSTDYSKMPYTLQKQFLLDNWYQNNNHMLEQIDEIRAVLGEKKYRDSWGYECSQYCFVDVQGDEVIVMDRSWEFSF